MIIKSPHPDAIIPEGVSFPVFVLRQFEEYKDRMAMISPKENKSYTYADLIRLTHQLASGLRNVLGLKQGDVVATSMGNSCEFVPIMLSVGLIGATLAPSNPAHTVDELAEQFRNCRVRFLVTTADMVEKMKEIQGKCRGIERIILKDSEIPGTVYLPDLFQDRPDSPFYPEINPRNDIMFLLNSSGTTGIPKAVMLTHYNIVANLCQICPQFLSKPAPEVYAMSADDVTLTVFPLFHIGGISNGCLWPLMRGSTCIVYSRYEPAQFVGALKKFRVTVIIVPPPILVFLAKSPDVSKADCPNLSKIFSGAAPITKELSEAVFSKIEPEMIIQGYGMTELSPMCHQTPSRRISLEKHGSCGVLVPSTECKVVCVETGKSLGPMEKGEICIRGPQIMKGYLNNPKATAETIGKDGFIHTGDIGHFDNDGYFFVVDRIKELIKVKGFQVAPAELEGLLLTHPAVADVAVVGIPDEYKGEIPRAYVVLKKGEKTSEEDVKNHLADRVASYKRLEGGVRFVDELPKTPSGKILRRLLRDQARQETESKTKKTASKL